MLEPRILQEKKTIALVAHDHKKDDLIAWIGQNKEKLIPHQLVATGTTGKLIEAHLGVEVQKVLSGPLGGDQQIGSMIANGQIDLVIFFWDPMEAQPHDSDVKALLRLGVVWNIPMACCPATADFVISSAYMDSKYACQQTDYTAYLKRRIEP
ncbi:methylglyoxal synthase [Arachidicoccus ginsenosidivorans]|jgi:methylglyoxal synthase|uniref:Methylglyoxal synthase n=1 Tax=Arachidicoccus ginsenosidivorans TaxID=496057 RepID=A0A5B8VJP7_9BACT|nr:methylglyoxal synthase [Arachidicoccus ginsenosidivorans]QEC70528.1 methylglyoxal synthase [Arachidicoccus ginsenosidivorans]